VSLGMLETVHIGPDGRRGRWRDEYWAAMREIHVPWMAEHAFELVGIWLTPIGAGESNQLTVLWECPDVAAWERWAADCSGPTRDPTLQRWREVSAQFVDRAESRLLRPSPGHDLTLLGAPAPRSPNAGQRSASWVYELELTEFRPEGHDGHWRRDYWPEFRQRFVPTLTRLGVELVGAWETSPGCGPADEHVFLYRVPDFAAWGRYLDVLRRATDDPVLRARRAEMWVWREVWHTRLMLPTPVHEVSLLHRVFE
jgi:hypothetical protein